jgi:tRNA uridine 5-carboxymethylaminomethyl modification enzyme
VNGLSTSLPFDVQRRLVHSIPGLERAEILRPAYAVEYDFAPPTQLRPSLESKKVAGLFFAGQINGTSGYEEAAGQGLIAGVNACNRVQGTPPLVIGRHEAYLGVLIDDLVTKGTKEPYRMFTSRAEHRLLFNHGSAELRLGHHAAAHKLVPSSRLGRIEQKRSKVEGWVRTFESVRHDGATFGELVRKGIRDRHPTGFAEESSEFREEVLYRVGYKGYLEREHRHVAKVAQLDEMRIPPDLDYSSIPGLRRESTSKLAEIRPATLGQASRISGVSPADISILMVRVEASRVARKQERADE